MAAVVCLTLGENSAWIWPSRVVYVQEQMLQLWCHEVSRVLADRMWDGADRSWLKQQLDGCLREHASTSWEALFGGAAKDCPSFAALLSQAEPPLYEPIMDLAPLKVSHPVLITCHVGRDPTSTFGQQHNQGMHLVQKQAHSLPGASRRRQDHIKSIDLLLLMGMCWRRAWNESICLVAGADGREDAGIRSAAWEDSNGSCAFQVSPWEAGITSAPWHLI